MKTGNYAPKNVACLFRVTRSGTTISFAENTFVELINALHVTTSTYHQNETEHI